MDTPPSQETPPPLSSPPPPSFDNERFWTMLVHLTALSGYFSFAGFFLGPVVVWLAQRDRFPAVTSHFHEAINFQLSMLLYAIVLTIVCILTLGLGFLIAWPFYLIIAILDLIFPILAAVRASEGQLYRYPLSIRMVRG